MTVPKITSCKASNSHERSAPQHTRHHGKWSPPEGRPWGLTGTCGEPTASLQQRGHELYVIKPPNAGSHRKKYPQKNHNKKEPAFNDFDSSVNR